MLALAEQLGVGTRDMKRIEVVGTPVTRARLLYNQARTHPEQVTNRA